MNFDDAVAAHSDWKRKLNSYLANPDHSLNPAEVAANYKCNLGQWIAGEGRKYSTLPEFANLTEAHTRFHKAAAAIVSKTDRGEDVSAEVALGTGSEFSKASSSVVLAIMQMKQKA